MNAIPDTAIFIFGFVIYAIFIGATYFEFKKAGSEMNKRSK